MREVEKSEGNYMSRERPIGNLGDRTEATNGPTKGQTKILFLVISEEEKAKKKCAMFIIHARCLRYFLLLLLLL
jgi:hypothetical protein